MSTRPLSEEVAKRIAEKSKVPFLMKTLLLEEDKGPLSALAPLDRLEKLADSYIELAVVRELRAIIAELRGPEPSSGKEGT